MIVDDADADLDCNDDSTIEESTDKHIDRFLGSSWSLLLSPNGEAAKAEHTQELLGFFYRGRSVRPVINEYCKETNGKKLLKV